MNVYTSYYWAYQHGKLSEDMLAISISRTQPEGLHLPSMPSLMPSWDTLNNYNHSDKGEQEEQIYIKDYNTKLLTLNAQNLWNQLSVLSEGRDIALLCYENNEKFCHRHLVAKWFTLNGFPLHEYGQEREWEEQSQNKQTDGEQLSIFDTPTTVEEQIAKHITLSKEINIPPNPNHSGNGISRLKGTDLSLGWCSHR